jgi:Flp pilus assembly protein TadD
MPQVSVQDALRLAQRHRDAGRFRDAESIYREILAQRPDHGESHHQLGLLAYQEGQHEVAIESLSRAVELKPEAWNFHTNLGAAFAALDRGDEAITAYLRALALRPDRAETYNNLGIVYREQDRLDLALAALDRAIALEPERAEFHTNRGAALEKLGLFEAAVWSHRRAIELNPKFAEAHFNLATSLLIKGEVAEGWDEYEWRWRCQGFQTRPSPYLQPMWDGSDPAGCTILLSSEQGMGDTIQFARYASLVSDRGARVVLGCPAPLQSLLGTVRGVEEVVTDGTKLPPFDLQLSLMSLPRVFSTTLDLVPRRCPTSRRTRRRRRAGARCWRPSPRSRSGSSGPAIPRTATTGAARSRCASSRRLAPCPASAFIACRVARRRDKPTARRSCWPITRPSVWTSGA